MRKTVLKNILLLLASLVFYAWGEPIYIVLLLVSIAANYGIGLLLGCQRDESVAAKAVLAAGILVNLGILGYYKYFDFFLRKFILMESLPVHISVCLVKYRLMEVNC